MANAEDVGDQLRSALTPSVTIVTADMTSTVFCDSSGIRSLLLAVAVRAEQLGGHFHPGPALAATCGSGQVLVQGPVNWPVGVQVVGEDNLAPLDSAAPKMEPVSAGNSLGHCVDGGLAQ